MSDPQTYRIDEIESAIIARIVEFVTYIGTPNVYARSGSIGPDFLKDFMARTPGVLLIYGGSSFADEVYMHDDYLTRDEELIFYLFVVSAHLRNDQMRRAGWGPAAGLIQPLSTKAAGAYDLIKDITDALEGNTLGLKVKKPFAVDSTELHLTTSKAVMYQIKGSITYERGFPREETCPT